MEFVATSDQIREIDRQAIEECHISSLELMEHAACAVADAVQELLTPEEKYAFVPEALGGATSVVIWGGVNSEEGQRELSDLQKIAESKDADTVPWIAVLCGPGNNGGDGIAAARLLLEKGYRVRAFLVGDRGDMTPDARAMEQRLKQAGGELEDFQFSDGRQRLWISLCDCKVDALFGMGLSRAIKGAFKVAVQMMQDVPGHSRVVSCDIPSGIHGDTGAVLGAAVRAGVTVTFTCAKPGHYLEEGAEHTGELMVVDIGIPHELLYGGRSQRWLQISTVEEGDVHLPHRPDNSHKGDYGKLFLLAGSEGYTGAPVLAAAGAIRSGAGLIFLGVPRDIYPIIAVKCSSAMPFPLPEDDAAILNKAKGCNVALLGPGLGRSPEMERRVRALLEGLEIPVVLDADGINALAGHIDILDRRRGLTVLTPHDGEFSRLTGRELPIENRLEAARSFAREHHCILVLKGHRTIIARPDGRVQVNTSGNPGMAKGGSGDVLAGMIASLLGQRPMYTEHTDWADVVAMGVYLHGAAGDRAAERLGEYSMTPSDLVEELPHVILRLLR